MPVPKKTEPATSSTLIIWLRRSAIAVGLIIWTAAGIQANDARDRMLLTKHNKCSAYKSHGESRTITRWSC